MTRPSLLVGALLVSAAHAKVGISVQYFKNSGCTGKSFMQGY